MSVLGFASAVGQERLLPIRLGRAYFMPSVVLSVGWDDNVERVNEEDPLLGPIDSRIGDIRPVLKFGLPLQKSLSELSYKGDFKSYSDEILKGSGGDSHNLDYSGQYQVGRRYRLDLGAGYLKGITAVLNSPPGGEFQYQTQPLTAFDGRVGFTAEVGPTQSVEMGATYSKTRFEQAATASFFSDYESQSQFIRYVVSGSPQTQIYASLEFQQVAQSRGELLIQPDDYHVRSVWMGFRRATSRELSSDLRIGYASTQFKEGLGTPFQGLTIEASLMALFSAGGQMALKLRRVPQVSFFNTSAYYLNEAAEITYRRPVGSRMAVQVFVGFQNNVFSDPIQVAVESPEEAVLDQDGDGLMDAYEYLLPSEGETRRDKITMAGIDWVWNLSRYMDFSLAYRYQESRSNVDAVISGDTFDIFNFEARTIQAAVVVGWL